MKEISRNNPKRSLTNTGSISPDWSVEINTSKQLAENEFDVIVIGAGMGGLACTALLAKWGYRPLLLEHHSVVGGYYGSFKRDGFLFNTGAMEITGLWDGGPLDLFLQDLGLNKGDYFVQNSYKYRYGGKEIKAFDGVDEFKSQFASLFPEEADNLDAFFNDARISFDEWYGELDKYGTILSPEIIRAVFGESGLERHMRENPNFTDWRTKSWKQKMDEHFTNQGLRDLLNSIINHMSADLDIAPAEAVLRDYGFIRHGSFFPKGGAQKLVEAIKRFIEDYGGKVLLSHRVERILTEDGVVKGVESRDQIFHSPVVVSSTDVKNTILSMVDRSEFDPSYIESIQAVEMMETYFSLFLGVDMDLTDHPTMIFDDDTSLDNLFHMSIHTNADPCYAPEGMASISIRTIGSYDDFPDREKPEYVRKKRAVANQLIDTADEVVPGLKENIIVRFSATPRTFERYTLATEGSCEGLFWSTEVKRLYFKRPLKGLYLAGSSAYPGAGLEQALMSGIICANDIDLWRGRARD
jgi:all-trans-retinol 13,14-reductase